MAIEILDLPIENGDFPSFLVCLPEATSFEPPATDHSDPPPLPWAVPQPAGASLAPQRGVHCLGARKCGEFTHVGNGDFIGLVDL